VGDDRPAGPPIRGGAVPAMAVARTRYATVLFLIVIRTARPIVEADLLQDLPRLLRRHAEEDLPQPGEGRRPILE